MPFQQEAEKYKYYMVYIKFYSLLMLYRAGQPNSSNLLDAISTENSSNQNSLSIICSMPFWQQNQQKEAKVVIWDISKMGYECYRKSQGSRTSEYCEACSLEESSKLYVYN